MEVQENNAVFVVILWQDPYEYNARYAVLISGGQSTDIWYDAFYNDEKIIHDQLKAYGWSDSNIYWYCWDKSPDASVGLDGSCTPNNVLTAFTSIGNVITKNDYFMFVNGGHGSRPAGLGLWYIGDKTVANTQTNTMATFKARYYDIIGNKFARSLWVFHSCLIGTDPHDVLGDVQNQIVISGDRWLLYTWTNAWDSSHSHFAFFNGNGGGFAGNMGDKTNPQSIQTMYNKGYDAAYTNGVPIVGGYYYPQLWHYYAYPECTYL